MSTVQQNIDSADAEFKAANKDARMRAASQIDQAGRGLGAALKELLNSREAVPSLKVIGILSTVQAYLGDATCLLAQRIEEVSGAPQDQPSAPKILVPGGKLLVPR